MRLTFLGTSAGTPTRTRNVTAQWLQRDDGRSWLLDCGEGTQQQILRAGLRAKTVDRILITHLHGDHCYGLPGLLSLMAIHGREAPVELIGPPGIGELIRTVLRLSWNVLPYRLDIHEVGEASEPLRRDGWTISAWPMVHRVPSWGYVLHEAEHPGRVHPERAQALGVGLGPDLGRLQRGESVRLPDGRMVLPAEVCDPPRAGRRLVLLGDTADAGSITDAGMDCALLVHEATYDATRSAKAIEWGHSTAAQAGRCAARLRAKRLIITHVSSRYDDDVRSGQASIADLLREAAAECPNTSVALANDLLTVEIPW